MLYFPNKKKKGHVCVYEVLYHINVFSSNNYSTRRGISSGVYNIKCLSSAKPVNMDICKCFNKKTRDDHIKEYPTSDPYL